MQVLTTAPARRGSARAPGRRRAEPVCVLAPGRAESQSRDRRHRTHVCRCRSRARCRSEYTASCMRHSRHVCGYIGREVGVLRYELLRISNTSISFGGVQIDSHVRNRKSGRQLHDIGRFAIFVPSTGPPGNARRGVPTGLESTQTTLRAQSTLYRHGVYSRLVGPTT